MCFEYQDVKICEYRTRRHCTVVIDVSTVWYDEVNLRIVAHDRSCPSCASAIQDSMLVVMSPMLKLSIIDA